MHILLYFDFFFLVDVPHNSQDFLKVDERNFVSLRAGFDWQRRR